MFREPDANLVKLGPDPVSQTNVSDPDLSFLNKFETDLKKSIPLPPPQLHVLYPKLNTDPGSRLSRPATDPDLSFLNKFGTDFRVQYPPTQCTVSEI